MRGTDENYAVIVIPNYCITSVIAQASFAVVIDQNVRLERGH